MRVSPLNRLCVKGNLVRSSAYSDVFRAVVSLDGETRTVDVEKIRVPLNQKRRETFWPEESDSQRDHRCRDLVSDLKRAGGLPGVLQADEIVTERIKPSFPNYLIQDAETDGEGMVNAYLVTPVMHRFLSDPKYFKRRYEIKFSDFLKVFFNILTAMGYMHSAGWCLGALDMDTVCTASGEELGLPEEIAGTDRVILTGFMYAGKLGEARPVPAVIPFHCAPELREGKPLTEQSDIYSVASIILTMLNGTYGSGNPSLEKKPGSSCPEPLSDALFATLSRESGDANLKGTLRKLIKKYQQGELQDFTFKIDTTAKDYWSDDIEDWESMEEEVQEPELVLLPEEEPELTILPEPEEEENDLTLLPEEEEEPELLLVEEPEITEPKETPESVAPEKTSTGKLEPTEDLEPTEKLEAPEFEDAKPEEILLIVEDADSGDAAEKSKHGLFSRRRSKKAKRKEKQKETQKEEIK